MHRWTYSLLALLSIVAPAWRVSADSDSDAQRDERPPCTEAKEDEEADESKDPMTWFGFGIKVGYAHIRSSNVPNPTYRPELVGLSSLLDQETLRAFGLVDDGEECTVLEARCVTRGRAGEHIALSLSFGRAGLGWDVEPYFQRDPHAKAYGVYTGPKFDIQVVDPLYLGVGLGVRAAWVRANGWDYGIDLYGRIPVRATVYVDNDFALVAEFGFGAGASGYADQPVAVVNPITHTVHMTQPSMTFGVGRTWDATIGMRFP